VAVTGLAVRCVILMAATSTLPPVPLAAAQVPAWPLPVFCVPAGRYGLRAGLVCFASATLWYFSAVALV
tara:strand:+ start:40357 stop:40563 length:207 start_codon:yes stop_codon:yes gene_type:complete